MVNMGSSDGEKCPFDLSFEPDTFKPVDSLATESTVVCVTCP